MGRHLSWTEMSIAQYWECTECLCILHCKMANLYFMNFTFIKKSIWNHLEKFWEWKWKCLLGNKMRAFFFIANEPETEEQEREYKHVVTIAREPEVIGLRGEKGMWLQSYTPWEEDTETWSAVWAWPDHHNCSGVCFLWVSKCEWPPGSGDHRLRTMQPREWWASSSLAHSAHLQHNGLVYLHAMVPKWHFASCLCITITLARLHRKQDVYSLKITVNS